MQDYRTRGEEFMAWRKVNQAISRKNYSHQSVRGCKNVHILNEMPVKKEEIPSKNSAEPNKNIAVQVKENAESTAKCDKNVQREVFYKIIDEFWPEDGDTTTSNTASRKSSIIDKNQETDLSTKRYSDKEAEVLLLSQKDLNLNKFSSNAAVRKSKGSENESDVTLTKKLPESLKPDKLVSNADIIKYKLKTDKSVSVLEVDSLENNAKQTTSVKSADRNQADLPLTDKVLEDLKPDKFVTDADVRKRKTKTADSFSFRENILLAGKRLEQVKSTNFKNIEKYSEMSLRADTNSPLTTELPEHLKPGKFVNCSDVKKSKIVSVSEADINLRNINFPEAGKTRQTDLCTANYKTAKAKVTLDEKGNGQTKTAKSLHVCEKGLYANNEEICKAFKLKKCNSIDNTGKIGFSAETCDEEIAKKSLTEKRMFEIKTGEIFSDRENILPENIKKLRKKINVSGFTVDRAEEKDNDLSDKKINSKNSTQNIALLEEKQIPKVENSAVLDETSIIDSYKTGDKSSPLPSSKKIFETRFGVETSENGSDLKKDLSTNEKYCEENNPLHLTYAVAMNNIDTEKRNQGFGAEVKTFQELTAECFPKNSLSEKAIIKQCEEMNKALKDRSKTNVENVDENSLMSLYEGKKNRTISVRQKTDVHEVFKNGIVLTNDSGQCKRNILHKADTNLKATKSNDTVAKKKHSKNEKSTNGLSNNILKKDQEITNKKGSVSLNDETRINSRISDRSCENFEEKYQNLERKYHTKETKNSLTENVQEDLCSNLKDEALHKDSFTKEKHSQNMESNHENGTHPNNSTSVHKNAAFKHVDTSQPLKGKSPRGEIKDLTVDCVNQSVIVEKPAVKAANTNNLKNSKSVNIQRKTNSVEPFDIIGTDLNNKTAAIQKGTTFEHVKTEQQLKGKCPRGMVTDFRPDCVNESVLTKKPGGQNGTGKPKISNPDNCCRRNGDAKKSQPFEFRRTDLHNKAEIRNDKTSEHIDEKPAGNTVVGLPKNSNPVHCCQKNVKRNTNGILEKYIKCENGADVRCNAYRAQSNKGKCYLHNRGMVKNSYKNNSPPEYVTQNYAEAKENVFEKQTIAKLDKRNVDDVSNFYCNAAVISERFKSNLRENLTTASFRGKIQRRQGTKCSCGFHTSPKIKNSRKKADMNQKEDKFTYGVRGTTGIGNHTVLYERKGKKSLENPLITQSRNDDDVYDLEPGEIPLFRKDFEKLLEEDPVDSVKTDDLFDGKGDELEEGEIDPKHSDNTASHVYKQIQTWWKHLKHRPRDCFSLASIFPSCSRK